MSAPFQPSATHPGGQVQSVSEYLGLADDQPLTLCDKPSIHALIFADCRFLICPVSGAERGEDTTDIPEKELSNFYQLSIPLA